MIYVVYFLAAIGGLLVTIVGMTAVAWVLARLIAKAQIRRLARRAALTLP